MNVWAKGQHRREFTWFSLDNALPFLSINSYDAALRLVEAARYGEAHVRPSAKMLRILNGLAPTLAAEAVAVAVALLPSTTGAPGDRPQRGYERSTPLAPSALTRPADRHIVPNYELTPAQLDAYEEG